MTLQQNIAELAQTDFFSAVLFFIYMGICVFAFSSKKFRDSWRDRLSDKDLFGIKFWSENLWFTYSTFVIIVLLAISIIEMPLDL